MTERLYYRDSTLAEFQARIVAVHARDGRLAVELDQTAFYPTSGGQPFDTGLLGAFRVVEVVDADGTVLHLLDPNPNHDPNHDPRHNPNESLAVGAEVVGRVDRDRRLDHTQQHTGQHVLSQAFERTAGLQTVSFHLGVEVVTIDLDHPRVEAAVVSAAEELANRVVLEDRPVRIHFARSDDLERFALRKPTQRTGPIRIVEVAEFDTSACGGTHVQRTGQIGVIKVARWERRGEETRVEFRCGWRAVRDYAQRLNVTRALAERLRVKDADLLAAATRSLDELDRQRAENADFRALLLEHEARDLHASASPLAHLGGARLSRQVFHGRSSEEIKHLALRLVSLGPAVAILGSTGDRAHVVAAQTPGLPFDLAAIFREIGPAMGLRGGGSRDLVQGGGPSTVSLNLVFDQIVARLSA